MKSISKRIICIYLLILSINFSSNKVLEEEEEDIITTITTDNESALRDALLILWKFGGIIYIDTPIINIKEQTSLSIKGTLEGVIIGV